MRGIILLFFVLPICGLALFKPKIGLLGYCWFSLMRPDILAWTAARYPYSIMIAACTVVGAVSAFPKTIRLIRNPFALLFILLLIPLILSGIFAVSPQLSDLPLKQFERAALMATLIVILTDTISDMRNLVLVIACSLGTFGMKFGLAGLLHGGVRYSSGIGGMMSENNTFALGLVMALPLIWYGRLMFESKQYRAVMLVMAGLTIATIVQSFSRGAAVALVFVFLLCAFRAKYRMAAFMGLILMAGPVFLLVQDAYTTRMATMLAPEDDGSARSRLDQVNESVTIWRMRPLLGVGFGGANYMMMTREYLHKENPIVVHNTYLEMLADSGIFAFLLWITILLSSIVWLGLSARKMKKLGNGLQIYPYALQTCIIAFAVDSTFHPRASFDFIYMMLMTVAAWYEIQRSMLQNPQVSTIQVAAAAGFRPSQQLRFPMRRPALTPVPAGGKPVQGGF